MATLVAGLRGRTDILDIADGAGGGVPEGLYTQAVERAFLGVLVAHRNLEGMPSAHSG